MGWENDPHEFPALRTRLARYLTGECSLIIGIDLVNGADPDDLAGRLFDFLAFGDGEMFPEIKTVYGVEVVPNE